jgi:hypothetical protein
MLWLDWDDRPSPTRHVLALLLVIGHAMAVFSASTLGERALSPLSVAEMETLVTKPDPSKSVDFNDPHSHLSKILIPRPRMSLLYTIEHCVKIVG